MLEMLESTLRLSVPLLFAAMGGVLCERSGIATICLEGVMITSAWTAAVVNYSTGNPWLAITAASLAGTATMGLHALLSVRLRADQIVSGVAVNLVASGMTPLLNKALYGSPTNTPSIPMSERFATWEVPGLAKLPFLGPLLFAHKPLVFAAILAPFALHYLFKKTIPGLRIIAAGDGPEALLSAGISPENVRWAALLGGGWLASFGGSYLSISHSSQFTRDMTAGRGYIALTALIFGKWKPLPTLAACLLFGFTDALQIQLQSESLFGLAVPVQLIQALPYAVTLFVLIGFVGKAKPPLSIGTRD